MKKKICLFLLLTLFMTSCGREVISKTEQSKNNTVLSSTTEPTSSPIYQTYFSEDEYERFLILDEQEWKGSDGTYHYPSQLNSFIESEDAIAAHKFAACQVPQSILNEMSTEELYDLVLQHPYLNNLYLYSGYSQALDAMRSTFNCIDELLKRKDCVDVVLKYYQSYLLPKEREQDKGKKYQQPLDFSETILATNSVYEQLTSAEKDAVIKEVKKKEKLKNTWSCYSYMDSYSGETDRVFLSIIFSESEWMEGTENKWLKEYGLKESDF